MTSFFSGTNEANPDSSEVQRLQRLRDEVHRLKREEALLERNYQLAQNLLKTMSEDENNQKLAYLTHTDIRNISEFEEETLLAVKAPYGSTLEVPDPDEVITLINFFINTMSIFRECHRVKDVTKSNCRVNLVRLMYF